MTPTEKQKKDKQFLIDQGYSLEAVTWFSTAEVRDIIDRILRRRANDKKRRQAKTNSTGKLTGIKDKTGREIRQGDIIRHTISPWADFGFGKGIEHSPVVWVQSEQAVYASGAVVSGWFIKTKVYGIDCDYMPIEEAENREIIGNIYDNPELLNPNL